MTPAIFGYAVYGVPQADLRAKTKQLKALAGELSMNQVRPQRWS